MNSQGPQQPSSEQLAEKDDGCQMPVSLLLQD